MLSFKLSGRTVVAKRGLYQYILEKIYDADETRHPYKLVVEKDGVHHYSGLRADAIQCIELAERLDENYRKEERAANRKGKK